MNGDCRRETEVSLKTRRSYQVRWPSPRKEVTQEEFPENDSPQGFAKIHPSG